MTHPEDQFDFQEAAETERIGHAIANGELELIPDDTAPIPTLPPPGSPVSVIRPIRVPHDVDEQIRRLAEARGVSMTSLMRGWIIAGLAADVGIPDPVAELRQIRDAAQRALDTLASGGMSAAA